MSHANRKDLKVFVKRAYENPIPEDGYRVLVDRIWPRGCSKEKLTLDQWARDLAPSAELRKWFGHEPKRWEIFQQRYRSELDTEEKKDQMRHLITEAGGRSITLVYGAKDEQHNQAIVLQDVLFVLART